MYVQFERSTLPFIKNSADNIHGIAVTLKTIPDMLSYLAVTSIMASLLVIVSGLCMVFAMRALSSPSGEENQQSKYESDHQPERNTA